MSRLIFVLGVLLIAGATHLASILAWPWLTPNAGYQNLAAVAADNHMTLAPQDVLRRALPNGDPAVAAAVCRYMLDRGPVRVRIPVGQTPTSVVFLRDGAGLFHSVSDKAASQGVLDVVIATQEQMIDITDQDSDDDPVQETRIVSPDETGLVLVRALTPSPSQRSDVERVLQSATCEAEALEK